ncbi:18791_t:CDS:2 [Entrophospora sp. SA101]|nr:18791_t:CDS:2 [Entrophospora sp. SA101]
MPKPKNHGPCVLEGCESHGPFRKFTEAAKCREFGEIHIVENDYMKVELSHILENSTDDIDVNFDYWSDININYHEDGKKSLSKESFDILLIT